MANIKNIKSESILGRILFWKYVHIREDSRGQGLGTQVYKKVLKFALENNIEHIISDRVPTSAIHFHKSLGGTPMVSEETGMPWIISVKGLQKPKISRNKLREFTNTYSAGNTEGIVTYAFVWYGPQNYAILSFQFKIYDSIEQLRRLEGMFNG